jgi:preprotein translocase subunit SecF
MSEDIYYNFMKWHKICFVTSVFVIFLSIVGFFINRLNFGIDFTGGLLFDINVEDNSDIAGLRSALLKNNFEDFIIQSYEKDGFIIRISVKDIAKSQKKEELSQTKAIDIVKNITSDFFDKKITYNKIDFVGPQVGKELILNGLFALLLSIIAIVIYIWVRFELSFGIGALITLFHDIIIVFGIYSIFKLDFDLTSVAAILTIIGYSVNDTVVIYDRIREYIQKYKKDSITSIIDRSLTATIRRTLLTSSTTLVSLLILGFIGGESIKNFSLVVFCGIVIGTYSSIFISAPLLVYIEKDKANLNKF